MLTLTARSKHYLTGEATKKESMTSELLPKSYSLNANSSGFTLASEMGAGNSLSSIYPPEALAFETVIFRFKALKGGRNRTKVPRPERQTRTA